MKPLDVHAAHKHASYHRDEVLRSVVCGCFGCLYIFHSSEIEEWIEGDQTALCPGCEIDSVIGCESGYAITHEFLSHMEEHWFGLIGKEGKPA